MGLWFGWALWVDWIRGVGLGFGLDFNNTKGPVGLVLVTRTNFEIIRKLRGEVWEFPQVVSRIFSAKYE